MKKIIDAVFSKPITFIAVLSVIINVCIEVLSRDSLSSFLSYITQSPITFLCNTAIIMLTLSISLLFKRRIFIISAITILWVALGIANKFMLVSGNTPLTIFHIANFGSAIKLSSIYMTIFEIVLLFLAIIAAILLGCFLWKKMPKAYRNMKKALFSIVTLFAICSFIGFNASATAPDFSDLSSAYEKYGFAYCFSYSVLNMGIAQPQEYSPEAVEEIVEKINIEDTVPEIRPNIIFVQLESFFDVKTLKNIELKADPVPNFTKLKEDFPSGYLKVSSIGGGTSNTEFEVMSGISLSNFGIGEYPYLTYLSENTCETVMRNLSEYGYTSTAIHSYTGTFYQRHEVFKKLGFDRFVSEEFMNIKERNPLTWAKDSQFLPYIKESLTSTEGPDLIYAITVQAHGKYIAEECENPFIINSNIDKIIENQMNYYIDQINEVDMFIADLVEEYSEYDEPTVIVFFGDHLPALEIKDEYLENGDIYKTEYVIWSNFELEAEDKDVEADMLSARVTSLLGMTNGTINKLNTYFGEDEDFKTMSNMLAYDILYGKNYANAQKYEPTNMKMGLGMTELTHYYFEDRDLYVKGTNFTPNSKITIDRDVKNDTEFIDENTLVLRNFITFSTSRISVAQVASDNTVLARANILLCEAQNPIKDIFADLN